MLPRAGQMEEVRQSVVERTARCEAVEEDDEDERPRWSRGGADQRECEERDAEESKADDGGKPEGSVTTNMKPTNNDASSAEAQVSRD